MEVFEQSARTVEVWADCWNQWRWIAGGIAAPIRAGMEWTQVESVMRMKGILRTDQPVIFAGLRVMEHAALEAIWKQVSKNGKR